MDEAQQTVSAGPAFLANEAVFRGIALGLAGLVALLLVQVQFCGDLGLPDKPPRPERGPVSMSDVAKEVEANPIVYKGYLEEDAKHFGLEAAPTVEQMSVHLPYQSDDDRRELDPKKGESLETSGLRLTTSLRRVKGAPRKLMVLTVENTTDEYLAYKVETRPTAGTKICHDKHNLGHNAMAIEPGGKIERSECNHRRGWNLEIRRVETLALTELSYHYVSRVPPVVAGIEGRVSNGHTPTRGDPCQVVLPAKIRADLDQGRLTWHDVVDFYARHRCDTYRLPDGYTAFARDDERPLPVMPDN